MRFNESFKLKFAEYEQSQPRMSLKLKPSVSHVSPKNFLLLLLLFPLQCLRTLVGHTGGVWSSQMRDNIIISGSTDRTLKVWNAETGECIHTLYGHTSTVRCMHLHEKRYESGSPGSLLVLHIGIVSSFVVEESVHLKIVFCELEWSEISIFHHVFCSFALHEVGIHVAGVYSTRLFWRILFF